MRRDKCQENKKVIRCKTKPLEILGFIPLPNVQFNNSREDSWHIHLIFDITVKAYFCNEVEIFKLS